MKVAARTEKPVVSRDVVNSLDLLHKSIALAMAERGELIIQDAPEA